MSDNKHYKLSDRPKWWLPRLFLWLAIGVAGIGFIAWLSSTLLYVDVLALGSGSDEAGEAMVSLTAELFDDIAYAMFEAIFAIAFLWLMAIAVDKLDQLVWLNASVEDRVEIIQKRKKKNAKNK